MKILQKKDHSQKQKIEKDNRQSRCEIELKLQFTMLIYNYNDSPKGNKKNLIYGIKNYLLPDV